jgi:hypothetical protein
MEECAKRQAEGRRSIATVGVALQALKDPRQGNGHLGNDCEARTKSSQSRLIDRKIIIVLSILLLIKIAFNSNRNNGQQS